MKQYIKDNRRKLKALLDRIIATDAARRILQIDAALELSVNMIIKQTENKKKIILIGNGASAAIASHMAVDFWKNAGIRAIAFNDASGLTCVSNDFGYKHVFEKPIEMFSESGDILIGISSSGKSENILLAAKTAKSNGLIAITLSGFSENNPLRRIGDINFYVPSDSYGHVEVLHHSICHCLVDTITGLKNG